MTRITIYHNPRCSTSRNTLALIRNTGTEPEIIEYLKDTPGKEKLAELIKKSGQPVRHFMRAKETVYKELGLDKPELSDSELLDFMVANPVIIERAIVTVGNDVVRLCRPCEEVLDVLPLPQLKAFSKENGEALIDDNGQRIKA